LAPWVSLVVGFDSGTGEGEVDESNKIKGYGKNNLREKGRACSARCGPVGGDHKRSKEAEGERHLRAQPH